MFSCNLPPALVAEWPGSFMCHCSNMGLKGYQSKSQHRKLIQEKEILGVVCTLKQSPGRRWTSRGKQRSIPANSFRMAARFFWWCDASSAAMTRILGYRLHSPTSTDCFVHLPDLHEGCWDEQWRNILSTGTCIWTYQNKMLPSATVPPSPTSHAFR